MQRKRSLQEAEDSVETKQQNVYEELQPNKIQKTGDQLDISRRCYRKFKKHSKLFTTSERMKGILLSCKQGREVQAISEILPILHKHCEELEKVCTISPNCNQQNRINENNTNVDFSTTTPTTTELDLTEKQTISSSTMSSQSKTNSDDSLQHTQRAVTKASITNTESTSSEENSDIDSGERKHSCHSKDRKPKRFEVYDAKTSGLVVIRILSDLISPVKLVRHTLEQERNRNFRFCCRLVPLEGICQANVDEILNHIHPFIQKHFHNESEKTFKYAVVYKCRNNNTVDKMKLIDGIVKLVGNEGHSVNLDNPEIVILIEIFKSACGFAIVRDFYTLHRFNLNLQTESSNLE